VTLTGPKKGYHNRGVIAEPLMKPV